MNQHYVPQFLLRNFPATEIGQIHVFDKQLSKTFKASTRNVAAETGFYDFIREGQLETFEPFFTRMEARTSPVIESILMHESIGHLSEDDRICISLFVAVQYLRTRQARQGTADIVTAVREGLIRLGANPDAEFPSMSQDDVKISSIDNLEHAREHALWFHSKKWILHRAPSSINFYISDHPVTVDNQVPRPGRGNLGLMSPFVEVYLPLSKRFSLCFVSDEFLQVLYSKLGNDESGQAIELDSECPLNQVATAISTGQPDLLDVENVVHQNSLQVIQSSRFVFSADGDFDLAQSMIYENPLLRNSRKRIVLSNSSGVAHSSEAPLPSDG